MKQLDIDQPIPDELCAHVAAGIAELVGGVDLTALGGPAIGMCQNCLDRADANVADLLIDHPDYRYEPLAGAFLP